MALDREGGTGAGFSPFDDDLRAVLAASGTGTWRWDAASGAVYWDETLEGLSGLPPGGFGSTYEAWLDTLHPDEVDGILAQVQEAIDRLGSYHFEHRTIWPDGTQRWLDCRGQVTADEEGKFSGTVGCAFDVTDRHRADDDHSAAFERERRLRDRLEFLATLTDTALVSDHHQEFMSAAAAAAVPKLGDWCAIHFLPDAGATMEVVVEHVDPDRVGMAARLMEQLPFDPAATHGAAAAIRTGRAEFIRRVTPEIVDAAVARSTHDADEMRRLVDQLAPTSVISVPLATSRGILGAIQFVMADSGRIYDDDDVDLAKVAASRVAEALDNLWLTEQHRHISATLQRALLPPRLPEIPGIEIAVRYWPAGAAVEAGGDFYDVFQTSPTSWSLLIGDVCGTGPDAAALTGLTRHTVRAAARHGQGHQAVLEWLNEAVRLSNRNRFCTADYATLTSTDARWQLMTCAAGHPLPILVREDGTARKLGRPGTLLGVLDDLDLEEGVADLTVGDVVVYYTDGLTDLRPPHGRTDDEMVDLIADLAMGRTAEDLAEAIHRTITDPLPASDRADDIAVVVLRVTAAPAV